MDTVWYNSSALMGLLGVFLGAVISFLGTMYSEYAKMKTLKKEQEFREQEKAKEKRELAHQHYLTLINENKEMPTEHRKMKEWGRFNDFVPRKIKFSCL